jgi:peroxiredoxin
MAGLTIGQVAPGFRLPSAQGPEVALEDFRGRQNVVVWFTKGMGCVFCRQHMSQLARVYPEIQKRNTEVLEIVPSSVNRGRQYATKYRLPFAYLCDADDSVRRAWHVDVRRHGPGWYAKTLMAALSADKPQNDFGVDPPALGEMTTMLRDDDAGLYLIDRDGVVRYAYVAAYIDAGTNAVRPLPPPEDLVRELERLAA